MSLVSRFAGPLVALSLSAVTACVQPGGGGGDGGTATSDLSSTRYAVYVDPQEAVTQVSGHVWDPEAFLLTFLNCGMDCPFPPLTLPGVPTIELSLVAGAQVLLFDPMTMAPGAFSPALTTPEGAWYIQDVVSRPGVPFFMVAQPPEPGGMHLRPIDVGLPPIPPAEYLPTNVMKPVFTSYTLCLGQSIPIASTGGVLQAVQRFLNANVAPTTMPDLLNPGRFGGVLVTWLYQPGVPVMRVPAFGATSTASAGQVLNIDWAPPGVLPPEANQSDRGFYVGPGPSSAMGITVTLLPPEAAGTPVQFTPVDPVEDEAQGRPYFFPPLPPMVAPPGLISVLEMQSLFPMAPPPPEWFCFGG